jgi:hypothetical protein
MRSNVTHLKLKMRSNVVRPFVYKSIYVNLYPKCIQDVLFNLDCHRISMLLIKEGIK